MRKRSAFRQGTSKKLSDIELTRHVSFH